MRRVIPNYRYRRHAPGVEVERVATYMDKTLANRAREAARRDGRSLANTIEAAVEMYVNAWEQVQKELERAQNPEALEEGSRT